MGKVFALDSPLMNGLSKLADLIWLNNLLHSDYYHWSITYGTALCCAQNGERRRRIYYEIFL